MHVLCKHIYVYTYVMSEFASVVQTGNRIRFVACVRASEAKLREILLLGVSSTQWAWRGVGVPWPPLRQRVVVESMSRIACLQTPYQPQAGLIDIL